MGDRLRHQRLAFVVLVVLGSVCGAGAQPQTVGFADRWTLTSTVMNADRDVLVSTPAGYATGKQRYPVLYITDGDGDMLHTVGVARFLADTGWIPELIVVGITQDDRMHELTPTRGNPLSWPGGITRDFPTAGGADRFLKFVSSEVIPFVEKTYRTQPYRILAGHSAGGLFVAHVMLSRPELFDAFIAASGAFRWDDEWVVRKAKSFFAERQRFDKTFFMTIGDEPISRPAWEHFRTVLSNEPKEGFIWGALELDDENHPSVGLRSYYFGLRKVFEIWPMPRDRNTGEYAGGLTGVLAHYERISKRLGFEVPPPEIVLYVLGSRARAGDELDKAIASFEHAVRLYGDKAYLYDSLGDALEAAGRTGEARRQYERAVEVGTATNDPRVSTFRANLERLKER